MGAALVIVNNLRTVATQLHEILPHFTKMPVELITERLLIEPGHVYIVHQVSTVSYRLNDEQSTKARDKGEITRKPWNCLF